AVYRINVSGCSFMASLHFRHGGSLVLLRDFVATDTEVVEESGQSRQREGGECDRFTDALPDADQRTDVRIGGQTAIALGTIRLMAHIHAVRAADARRFVEPCSIEGA